jgi:hypothetical protein
VQFETVRAAIADDVSSLSGPCPCVLALPFGCSEKRLPTAN